MKHFIWTAPAVHRALGLACPIRLYDTGFSQISTDTRALRRGALFIALRGARYDGHDYLAEAYQRGAIAAVVDRPFSEAASRNLPAGLALITVPDTLAALGAVASYRRSLDSAYVIAIVGSNGKTTTRNLVSRVLAPRFRVHATTGNLNNRIGVPLSILNAPRDADIWVLELGTNEPGEIDTLSAIVRPNLLVVTSIGEEHLEGFGTVDGVLDEEVSAFRHLAAGGVGVLPNEPMILERRARALAPTARILRVGTDGLAPDFEPTLSATGSSEFAVDGHLVQLPLPGRHNIGNALLAFAVAQDLGVPAPEIAQALSTSAPEKLRGEWSRIGALHVLADCYNSNPPSAEAAIRLLAELPGPGRKLLVLGTMRELGAASSAMHQRVLGLALSLLGSGIDQILATGEFSDVQVADDLRAQVVSVSDPIAALQEVLPRLDGTETIVLKGSRGVALERLLLPLEEAFGQGPAGQ